MTIKMASMKGGNEEGSYANNSGVQARVTQSMIHYLKEALDTLRCPFLEEKHFTVADLGCGSGKNTLNLVDFIINHVTNMHESRGYKAPEFQVFLSDLSSNDFNTLFGLLPPLEVAISPDQKCRDYFVAGVPGSFYGRLFHSRSVHVFHSAFSVHWLSQVPMNVEDSRSPSYNKGRIFVHGSSASTGAAYKHQFLSDFGRFLEARAHELKCGGVMYLVCVARISIDPTDQAGQGVLFGTFFQDAWDDLVHEGLIEIEKRDTFNIPLYAPSLEEVREAVETNGSFHIRKLELEKFDVSVMNIPENEAGPFLADKCRTLVEVLVESHIGKEKADALFVRMKERAKNPVKELKEQLCFYHVVCSLSLKEV